MAEELHDIPVVESPYAGRTITIGEHLNISSMWFAMNFLWSGLLLFILPNQAQRFAPKDPAPLLGLLTSVGAVAALIIPLFVGALSDRCYSSMGRRRPYIAVGTAFVVAGLGTMLAAALDVNLFLYFIGYIVLQFGANVVNGAYTGVIPDLVPREQHGIASGFLATMSGLGTAAGAWAVGSVLDWPWLSYGVLAGVMAGVCILMIRGVRENPLPCRPQPLRWMAYIKSLWIDPKIYPDFAWVWLTRALVMLSAYAVQPFLLFYLRDVLRAENPEKTLRYLLSLIIVATIVTGMLGGWVSDRIGRKRVVYLANGLMAAITFGFAFCRSVEWVIVLGVLFGLGYGAYVSVDWALGTDVLPSKEHAGKDMAIWHVAQALPQAIGATSAGYLLSAFGTYETVQGSGPPVTHYYASGFTAMFILASVFLLLGAVLLRNVKGVK